MAAVRDDRFLGKHVRLREREIDRAIHGRHTHARRGGRLLIRAVSPAQCFQHCASILREAWIVQRACRLGLNCRKVRRCAAHRSPNRSRARRKEASERRNEKEKASRRSGGCGAHEYVHAVTFVHVASRTREAQIKRKKYEEDGRREKEEAKSRHDARKKREKAQNETSRGRGE